MNNTHLVPEHPNRTVMFLDNGVPIPIISDYSDPNASYQIGFALSKSTRVEIEEFEPSLIHITCPDCTCLHLIQYAREKEIPLMGTYHSNIPEYLEHYPGVSWFKHILRAFFRHQYNFLQALYAPTPYIQRHLAKHYHLDKGTNLCVWGRGIDLEKFSTKHRSLDFRRKLGIADHEVVILWVGRLVAEKRPDIFARVVKRLHAQGIPFKAVVVGAGPNDDQIIDLPNTHFLGWLSGDELSVAYASSDVFLFPSAVETFGNVTLEAAASGLPLVVESGCSGHLVENGVNGFACGEDDENSWFEGTLNLVVNHEFRRNASVASRNLSLNYEKGTVMRRMIDNYTRVTDEFFTEFGGRHENRDIAFTRPDSFPGGTHPRPLGLMVIEFVVVCLLKWAFNIESFYYWMKGRKISSSSEASTVVVVGPDGKNIVAAKKNVGSHDDTDDEEDPETQELLSTSDASTVASTATGASLPTSQPAKKVADFKKREPCACMHVAARIFIALIFLQWRMESNFRKAIGFVCSPSKWTTVARQRKDSSVADAAQILGKEDRSLDENVSLHGNRGDEELGRRVRSAPMDG